MARPTNNWRYVEVKNDDYQADPWNIGPFRTQESADDAVGEIKHLVGLLYPDSADKFSYAVIPLTNVRDFMENTIRYL